MTSELRRFFQVIGREVGRRTARQMTAEERQARAKKAAEARWAKRRKS